MSIDEDVDDIFDKIENLKAEGYFQIEDTGERISGSIKTENKVLKIEIGDKKIEKNIDELRKMNKEGMKEELEKKVTSIRKKIKSFIGNFFMIFTAIGLVGPFGFILAPLLWDDTILFTLKKIKSLKIKDRKVGINGKGELKIEFKDKKYVMKVSLTKGNDTIPVEFDNKKYEISLRNTFAFYKTAIPLFGHFYSIFEEE